jgi:protein ImuB
LKHGRLGCVDIPALPLQLLLRGHEDWRLHPAAVVDRDKAQGKLLWVNEEARCHGILPGMRYAAALSLTRELRAGVIEEGEIVAATEQLAQLLRHFSAEVEPSEEVGVFWLDADGLSLLYPSLKQWNELLHGDLKQAGWIASSVVGFTRFGSYALAKAMGDKSLAVEDPSQEERWARRVPLQRLGFPPQLHDRLSKLGIEDLGGFMDLPGDGVLRRFGREIHRLHQLARGELWAPLNPSKPREPLVLGQFLDHAERDLERLLHQLQSMLEGLFEKLRARHQLLRALHLVLSLEDRSQHEATLRPAQATLDLPALMELLRLRLSNLFQDGKRLKEGIQHIALELIGVDPSKDQLELFADTPGRDLSAAQRALARLRAAFGENAVLCPALRQGHLPEARFEWKRLQELKPARPRAVDPGRRPLVRRLFQKAKPLSRQRRNEPDGWMILGLEGGAVQQLHGPYILSGGWWVRELAREYYYLRTPKTGWLWVYFDRRRRRWFWQGVVE